jgi:hypothetical protein
MSLRNVLPIPARRRCASAGDAYAEALRNDAKGHARSPQLPDLSHFLRRQLPFVAALSFGMAVFCNFVLHVVIRRAGEQVERIETSGNVASMQDVSPGGKRPINRLVDEPMRGEPFVRALTVETAAKMNQAVTIRSNAFFAEQAGLSVSPDCLLSLIYKPFRYFGCHAIIVHQTEALDNA